MERTNMDISMTLRNKLAIKKNHFKFKKLGDLVQAMYNLISKHKMWGELKEEQKK